MRSVALVLAIATGLSACARAPERRMSPGDPPIIYEERTAIPDGPAVPILLFMLAGFIVTSSGDD